MAVDAQRVGPVPQGGRLRAHRVEQRGQATRRLAPLAGHGQVALGKELHLDQQELTLLGRLSGIERVVGKLEPASGLHLAHATLTLHTPGLGLALLDLHPAEPVAPVLLLPTVLPLIFVTLQRLRRRSGLQGRHHGFPGLAVDQVIDAAPVQLAAEQL
ncbi:hypothetical protein D3C76_1235020 [compost metagenome]